MGERIKRERLRETGREIAREEKDTENLRGPLILCVANK